MSRKMIDYKVENGTITSIDGYEVGGGGTAVEANPQEEATQQLEKIKIDNTTYNIAGGGSYNVAVTSTKFDTMYKNNVAPRWNGNFGLKANTSYEIGDQVQVYIKADFNNKVVNSNQIYVPLEATLSLAPDRTKLQFGDVILVATYECTIPYSYHGTVTDQDYIYYADYYITYTVVKAGTTGANVDLPTTGFSPTLEYMITTLGVTQAAQ